MTGPLGKEKSEGGGDDKITNGQFQLPSDTN